MTKEKERKHEELLVRIAVHAEEMRFNKGQQWRTLYYAVLFLAATALAFQQPIYLGQLYPLAKVFGLLTVVIVVLASIVHLLAIKYDIDLNRAASKSMEEELNHLTGITERLNARRPLHIC